MRHIVLQSHFTKEELFAVLNEQTEVREFREWQIIYSIVSNTNKTAEEIADILGVTKSKIYRIIQQYNKNGKEWRKVKLWGGRRKSRSYFTLEEEAIFMKEMETSAAAGKILTYRDIKREIEKKLTHLVSDDYIWDLFKRHKWKKKSPRPKHPKSDAQAQEDFKKNFSRVWNPPH